jgi:lysophospholipase L1-like esterase
VTLAATTFAPDIVIILLGTNDTKPQNWRYKSDFSGDLRDLIRHFATLPSKPKISKDLDLHPRACL